MSAEPNKFLEILQSMPLAERLDWIDRFNKLTIEDVRAMRTPQAAQPSAEGARPRRMKGNPTASVISDHCQEHDENYICGINGKYNDTACQPVDLAPPPSDRDMTEVIARDVMGWTFSEDPERHGQYGYRRSDKAILFVDRHEAPIAVPFEPFESWVDAGMVAEALAQQEPAVNIVIRKSSAECAVMDGPELICIREGKSGPRAISLAAYGTCQPVEPPTAPSEPRMMQANLRYPSDSYHGVEHVENPWCKDCGCKPIVTGSREAPSEPHCKHCDTVVAKHGDTCAPCQEEKNRMSSFRPRPSEPSTVDEPRMMCAHPLHDLRSSHGTTHKRSKICDSHGCIPMRSSPAAAKGTAEPRQDYTPEEQDRYDLLLLYRKEALAHLIVAKERELPDTAHDAAVREDLERRVFFLLRDIAQSSEAALKRPGALNGFAVHARRLCDELQKRRAVDATQGGGK